MNKQNKLRKLSLQRETLVQLQMNDLEDVNGGTGALCRSVFTLSARYCSPVSRSLLESAKQSCFCSG
jgi:hypothetical protein